MESNYEQLIRAANRVVQAWFRETMTEPMPHLHAAIDDLWRQLDKVPEPLQRRSHLRDGRPYCDCGNPLHIEAELSQAAVNERVHWRSDIEDYDADEIWDDFYPTEAGYAAVIEGYVNPDGSGEGNWAGAVDCE